MKTGQSGFTLLEVIVAMVLIASVGMGLYAWINSCLIGLGRVQEHELRREAAWDALAFMENVNPMDKPSGEAKLGPYQIQWEAALVEPVKESRGHSFGLYDTRVRIEMDGREIGAFGLRQVGHRRTESRKPAWLGG